jgi:hypothetical protein
VRGAQTRAARTVFLRSLKSSRRGAGIQRSDRKNKILDPISCILGSFAAARLEVAPFRMLGAKLAKKAEN